VDAIVAGERNPSLTLPALTKPPVVILQIAR
jgi:hypothetical protein